MLLHYEKLKEMDANKYSMLTSSPLCISRSLIEETVSILKGRMTSATDDLNQLLQSQPITKPEQHNGDSSSDYFDTTALSDDILESICGHLLEAEADAIPSSGETTPEASRIASLVDLWHERKEKQKTVFEKLTGLILSRKEMAKRYIKISTSKFPVLEGEEDEVVNPGTFGKAFAQYIEEALKAAGYNIPFVICEDWGWWVEVKTDEKTFGITCYRAHDENTECEFACAPSPDGDKVWSWGKFRKIDISTLLDNVNSTLLERFREDPDIEILEEQSAEFPL